MAPATATTEVFERALEDLTDDAELAGNRLSRQDVDNLYIRRNIDPDHAIAIEKALVALGIAIEDDSRVAEIDVEPNGAAKVGYESALDHLLTLAKGYPLLTSDEEAACGEAIHRGLTLEDKPEDERSDVERRAIVAGHKARAKLITSNIRLITKIIFDRHYRDRHDRDDMAQLGLMGLMKAAERFDPAHECRFSTYAMWWIRQSVHRGIDNEGRTIRVPVHVLQHVSRFRRMQRSPHLMQSDSGKSIKSIAEALGWSEPYTARIAQLAEMRTVSLDAKLGPESDVALQEIVPDAQPDPEEITVSNDTAQRVRSMIDELDDDRLKDIVRRRFGFDGPEETLESIGQDYDVTRERIRQLEAKALDMLKRRAIKKRLTPSEDSA